MGEQFTVEPAQVREIAQAIASRQEVPAEQGDEATSSAGGIDTGDPSLDGEARNSVNQYRELLAEVTRKLTHTAQWLNRIAEDYEGTDQDVAASFDEIVTTPGPQV